MGRWKLKAKVHKIRSKLLKVDALVMSLVRNPEATLEDIKKARETLLRIYKQVAEVEKTLSISQFRHCLNSNHHLGERYDTARDQVHASST